MGTLHLYECKIDENHDSGSSTLVYQRKIFLTTTKDKIS
jgi:hypothetical protein